MSVKIPNEAANAKTRELVLFIAERLKDSPGYGATLLNKALFFVDNLSYLNRKEPISNLNYVKQDFGPTPMPSQFLALKNSMINNQEMTETISDYFGLAQKKCIPLRQPDLTLFEKEEIILIDKVLASISGHSATSISELTHRFIAWKLADNMEELPYYTTMLTSKIPTEEDIAWAKAELAKFTA